MQILFIVSNKKWGKCVKGVYFVTMINEIHIIIWYNIDSQPLLSNQVEHVCKMKYTQRKKLSTP